MLAALEEHEERRIKKSNIKLEEKKEKARDGQNNIILKYLGSTKIKYTHLGHRSKKS